MARIVCRGPTGRSLLARPLCCTLLLISCGGDGVRDSGDMTGGMLPPAVPSVTLVDVQAAVFTPSCAVPTCHVGTAPPEQLNLEEGMSAGALIGVPSTVLPMFVRVVPGNPDDSYLFMKITGDARISGDPMPLIGGPLTDVQLALVRDWIMSGAAVGSAP